VFTAATLLAGRILVAQHPETISGRFTLREMDGRPLPYVQNWDGRLEFAIESAALDFYRPDSVRLIGAVRDGTLVHAPCSVLREMRAEQGRGVGTGGLSAGTDTTMAGCDDLRVDHQTTLRAFTLTNHFLVLKPRSDKKYDVPFSGEVRGDTVILWKPIGTVDKSGHAPLVKLVFVRE
jgi:hypothetical protein